MFACRKQPSRSGLSGYAPNTTHTHLLHFLVLGLEVLLLLVLLHQLRLQLSYLWHVMHHLATHVALMLELMAGTFMDSCHACQRT